MGEITSLEMDRLHILKAQGQVLSSVIEKESPLVQLQHVAVFHV